MQLCFQAGAALRAAGVCATLFPLLLLLLLQLLLPVVYQTGPQQLPAAVTAAVLGCQLNALLFPAAAGPAGARPNSLADCCSCCWFPGVLIDRGGDRSVLPGAAVWVCEPVCGSEAASSQAGSGEEGGDAAAECVEAFATMPASIAIVYSSRSFERVFSSSGMGVSRCCWLSGQASAGWLAKS
jgi:hypothetical protein